MKTTRQTIENFLTAEFTKLIEENPDLPLSGGETLENAYEYAQHPKRYSFEFENVAADLFNAWTNEIQLHEIWESAAKRALRSKDAQR